MQFSAADRVNEQIRFALVGYHDFVVRFAAADQVHQQIERFAIVLCDFSPPIEYSTHIGFGLIR